jgi:tripartite-type tricarboxylate transporter receptor subunit TctC
MSELLQQRANIKLNIVPYRGGAPMVVDLLGGHVPLGIDIASNVVPLARDGKVRMLAVTGSNRMQDLPDVPTVQQEINAPFEATAWFAVMVAKATPADVVTKINSVMNAYLRSEKGKAALGRLGMEAAGGSPAEAEAFIQREIQVWEPVIKAANIQN